MRDSMRLLAGFILFAAIFTAGLFLLINGVISSSIYYVLVALSLIVLVLSFFAMRGEWVSFDGETIRIEAPFAKLDIPKESIRAINLDKDFRMGLRVFGYGGMNRGSGNFSNDSLGDYFLAGNNKFPMIVVRFEENGKERHAAFNLPGEDATLKLYGKLTSEGISSEITQTTDSEPYRKKRKSLAITVFAIIAVTICLSAVVMSIGSATAHIEDEELIIDGTMYHKSVALEDIEGIELRQDMDYGARIAGLGNSKALTGQFRNSEFGDYSLCVNRSVDRCIVIWTSSGIVAFNLQTSEDTNDLFNELSKMIG